MLKFMLMRWSMLKYSLEGTLDLNQLVQEERMELFKCSTHSDLNQSASTTPSIIFDQLTLGSTEFVNLGVQIMNGGQINKGTNYYANLHRKKRKEKEREQLNEINLPDYVQSMEKYTKT